MNDKMLQQGHIFIILSISFIFLYTHFWYGNWCRNRLFLCNKKEIEYCNIWQNHGKCESSVSIIYFITPDFNSCLLYIVPWADLNMSKSFQLTHRFLLAKSHNRILEVKIASHRLINWPFTSVKLHFLKYTPDNK